MSTSGSVLVSGEAVGLGAGAEAESAAFLVEPLLFGLVLRLEPREHPGFALHIGTAEHDTKVALAHRNAASLLQPIAA